MLLSVQISLEDKLRVTFVPFVRSVFNSLKICDSLFIYDETKTNMTDLTDILAKT